MTAERLLIFVSIALAGTFSLCLSPRQSSAQAPPARFIPFDGVLELDGAPVNGQLDMRFGLYAAVDSPNEEPCQAESGCLWRGTLPVEIAGGRFSALLGAAETPLPDEVFLAEGLYLEVELADPVSSEWIGLANRQRIVPSPAAQVATGAPDFHVREQLTVDGDLRLMAANATLQISQDFALVDDGTASLQLTNPTGGGRASLEVDDLTVHGVLTQTGGGLTVSQRFEIGTGELYNQQTPMISTERSICFLTTTDYSYYDFQYSAYISCRIEDQDGQWVLVADGEWPGAIYCVAHCLSW